MQSAETVLEILRERGRRNLPCEELYRQLFNPSLYLLAHGRIYSNQGAMTRGVSEETADGMSPEKIESITHAMRHERYRFSPARRTQIPKKNGKMRPLSMPTWSDKLVGEVVRLLLEAYYEPTFSRHSHGFRPGRGCHTALREVANAWSGTVWFIEGDIDDCFGSLDHEVMIRILSENIHDNRFLRLIRNMLTAGYLEDWKWTGTPSGAPQGGIVSPVLSNIYLTKLDEHVEKVLIPRYTQGKARKPNPDYTKVNRELVAARTRGDKRTARELRKKQRQLPTGDPQDPRFRRLTYSRYADDHLLGLIGSRAEAEHIKDQLATFLHDELKLELSAEKTQITHARTKAARYLGYEITTQANNSKTVRGTRVANGKIGLRVPLDVIAAKRALYRKHGKPWPRSTLQNLDDHDIVNTFGAEFRGTVQYYMLANDVWRFTAVQHDAQTSMLKTLAAKHDSTVSKMATRYRAKIETPKGIRTCYEATVERKGRKPLVARFGGIPLARNRHAVLDDRTPKRITYPRKELTLRLLAGRCELCGTQGKVQVHQVHRMASLGTPGPGQPAWAELMTQKRRKTLIVCQVCHEAAHEQTTTLTA